MPFSDGLEAAVPTWRGREGDEPSSPDLPLLDRSRLKRLYEELDMDTAAWRNFVGNYIALLPHRVERLWSALSCGDFDEVMDAVLSLRTSSHMAGAVRMAAIALDLCRALRNHPRSLPPDGHLSVMVAVFGPQLRRCADATVLELEEHLQRSS
jgi:hypothetical protein